MARNLGHFFQTAFFILIAVFVPQFKQASACDLVFKYDPSPEIRQIQGISFSQKNGYCTPEKINALRDSLRVEDKPILDNFVRSYSNAPRVPWRSFFRFDNKSAPRSAKYLIVNAQKCYQQPSGCSTPATSRPIPSQEALDRYRSNFGVEYRSAAFNGAPIDDKYAMSFTTTVVWSDDTISNLMKNGYQLSVASEASNQALGELGRAFKIVTMGARPPDFESMEQQARFIAEAKRSIEDFEARATEALQTSLKEGEKAQIATNANYQDIQGSDLQRYEAIQRIIQASASTTMAIDMASANISKVASENLSRTQYTAEQIAAIESGKLPADTVFKVDGDVGGSIDQFAQNLNLDAVAGIEKLIQSESHVLRIQQYQNILGKYLDEQGLVKAWYGDGKVRLSTGRYDQNGMQIRQVLNEAAGLKLYGRTLLQLETADYAIEAAVEADKYLAITDAYSQEKGRRLSDRARTLVDYQTNSKRLPVYSRFQTNTLATSEFGVRAVGTSYEGFQIANVANTLAGLPAVLNSPELYFYAKSSLMQANLYATAPGEGLRFHQAIDTAYAVVDFAKGFAVGLYQIIPNTYDGFKQIVLHPIDSVEGLYLGLCNAKEVNEAFFRAIDNFVAEFPNYTAEQYGELSGRVTGEVGAAMLGAGLVKKASDLVKFNLAIAKISEESRIVLRLPNAVKFEGKIYRGVREEFKSTIWDVVDYDANPNHRYSQHGVKGIYASLDELTLKAELENYGFKAGDRIIGSVDANIDRVLDMTDPRNLNRFGVSIEQLTQPKNYVTTHIIGEYASKAGFDALIYRSATSEGKHIVLFKSLPKGP